MTRLTILSFVLLLYTTAMPAADQRTPTSAPDLLIVNGSVLTMDRERPKAQAVAVSGNRITAVGTTAELQPLANQRTRLLDAQGYSVLPGFNDAHVHFLSGGFSLSNVQLRAASSPQEMARLLGAFAKTQPKGKWILGGEWDHEKWPGAPLPTRAQIDAVTSENPVFVNRLDGHMGLANSLALRAAGISASTQDPPGGLIIKDEHGEPTGILKDAAQDLIERAIPPKTFEEKLAAAKAASEFAARLGVTSVTDMSANEDVRVYQELLRRGQLNTRIYAMRTIVSWEPLAQAGITSAFGSDMLRVGGLKGFADGSLGSTTALFFQPYDDAPNTRGLLFDQMLPEGVMLDRVLHADKAGLQVMIHAIGDEANARILDLYETAAQRNGSRDRRFRIEHAQHLRPSDIPRFGRQHVIASMQPYHAADDGRWCEKRLGTKRAKGAYVFRSLLDSGAVLAFGSDWTVAPLDPLQGIQAAVTRQTLDDKHPNGWIPEQKITLEEAIRGYTVGSAYAEFAETAKGTLTVGKLADLVIFDQDLSKISPDQIGAAHVTTTILDGRIVSR